MIDDIKTKTLHMIGNGHLDPVWLWQWQEGFQAAKATFQSVLNLMAECDDFLFTSSSAAIYEWIEANDPAMFAEIAARVAEGRWEIVGGWWIQPDCNLPGGESFVRQGLYGQRYFAEKLGVTATVGYNVDSFGHAASLPQILRKSGMSSYVFTRPHPHEQRLPARLFWWESADGSRVLTFRIPYEYNTSGQEEGVHQQVRRVMGEFKGPLAELMCFYGVGNHGGGPTRQNLAAIRSMNADPACPRLVFSTPTRYFRNVEPSEAIPVVQDELQHHASGCYAAHSGVKRWNRQAENLLLTAEKFSSLAHRVTGLPYPCTFAAAWKDVLFNQFHDILAGTSIEPAYDDARNLYGEAMAIAGRNLNGAIQSLSWRIDIPEEDGSRPIVLFNEHSWPVRTGVEVEFGRLDDRDVLLDSGGKRVPLQRVQSLATVSRGSRSRLAFVADLPAYGYEVFRVMPGGDEPVLPTMDADDLSLENAFFRLAIDPATGCLQSLYDKRLRFEWLRREAAKPLVLNDRSDTWSHGVLRYGDVAGAFSPRAVTLIEHGPVKSTIRVESTYGRSTLIQRFTMYRELDRIDVQVTVDWHERFKLLKLNFPLNLYYSTATYEIPYGFIHRPTNGEEEPGQSWVDLTGIGRNNGTRLGMSLLNDGKYSFDMTEQEINLTVLRTPIYAHHTPTEPEPDRPYTFIDQGVQHFTYTLLPHDGSWEDAGTVKRAAELNAPPVAMPESYHAGPLPQRDSYLAVDRENVVVTTIKRAEDGDDLILRCRETSGVATTATIRLPRWNRTIEAFFDPSEIKTFRLPRDENAPVRETNLIEWNEEGG